MHQTKQNKPKSLSQLLNSSLEKTNQGPFFLENIKNVKENKQIEDQITEMKTEYPSIQDEINHLKGKI